MNNLDVYSLYWPYYRDEHAVARSITKRVYGPGNDLYNAERTFRTFNFLVLTF